MLRHVCVCTALSLAAGRWTAPTERVSIERRDDGAYGVVSSVKGPLGQGGEIRGAGGSKHIEAASSAGADAIRTWGVGALGQHLKEAEAAGLRVSAGIWLPHSPSWYEDCSDLDADPKWQAEMARYIKAVREHENSVGLLWWTVGNEIELDIDVTLGSECTWRRLEWVVRAVKAEDPNHPVGYVSAGPHVAKIKLIGQFAPSLDFLGVNAYGEASLIIGDHMVQANVTMPYAIMEFGPTGHWAAPVTEWGAVIEESSSQKVPRYNATCHTCYDDPRCLGAFAFVWGWKWETTGTWYGVFNEWPEVTEGVAVNCPVCESEVMETMETCWTGKHRVDRPPTIASVSVDGAPLPDMSFVAPRRKDVELRVDATHPVGRDLVGIWGVTDDMAAETVGAGAFEETKPLLRGMWPDGAATGTGLSILLDTSKLPVSSEYRLYVFVRQDPASCVGECKSQEAVASLPFRICHDVVEGEVCYRHVGYAMQSGIKTRPEQHPGLRANSSFAEVQMMLHQQGVGGCPPPCGVRSWCRTSVKGEDCYEQVRWLMERVSENPHLYPAELRNASFEATQGYIQAKRDGTCPRPCAEGAASAEEGAAEEGAAEEGAASAEEGAEAAAAAPPGVAADIATEAEDIGEDIAASPRRCGSAAAAAALAAAAAALTVVAA